MSLTIAQRAEIIQRKQGCTRDEALRRARVADGAARDAAERAARVQVATAGTVQRTRQTVSSTSHDTAYITNTLIAVDCSESTTARDTCNDPAPSSDPGSFDCGGGGF